MVSRPAVCLLGPTASGKTGWAVELAARFPFEIVNVDSVQVYRHMDIGTAKPDSTILQQAPHHLIDIVDPDERYSAARFCDDATRVVAEIFARGNVPLLVGGTMLYFKALLEGLSALPAADRDTREMIDRRAQDLGWPALHAELATVDPPTAARLQPLDSQRIQRALEVYYLTGQPMSELIVQGSAPGFPYRTLTIALMPGDRSVLHQRIAARFDRMLELGFIEEVEGLRRRFELNPSLPSMRAVGYRQVWQYLEGAVTRDQMRQAGVAATRQLAKRQLTWLRAWPRATTFDCLTDDALSDIENYLDLHLSNERPGRAG